MSESDWGAHAEHLLEQALDEVRDGRDAIMTVSMALAVLRAEAGELPADEAADLAAHLKGADCTCPPDLVERGGFQSSCPVHGPRGSHG